MNVLHVAATTPHIVAVLAAAIGWGIG